MFHPMKPETIARKLAEEKAEREAIRVRLLDELVKAAWRNRHNPTGRDFLDAAKQYRTA